MSSITNPIPNTLAIGLGGNISSFAGSPTSTLIAARPIIERTINEWAQDFLNENASDYSSNIKLIFRWSPLFKTKPIGGPENQPSFINAVLIVGGENFRQLIPSFKAASDLFRRFCEIEVKFGRERIERWGPRSLDIDLLAWGNLHIHNAELTLPHPRLLERDFVIIPLAEALKASSEKMPIKITPLEGWKE